MAGSSMIYAARVAKSQIHQVGRVTAASYQDRIDRLKLNCHRHIDVVRTIDLDPDQDASAILALLKEALQTRGQHLGGAWYQIEPEALQEAFLQLTATLQTYCDETHVE